MKRLAIITTHPIQYNAPLFKLLTERNNIIVRVFYTWGSSVLEKKFDPGFGKVIDWDIPILDGYDYLFVKNISKKPGSHHFMGINNPTLTKEIVNWGADAILIFGWNFKSHLHCMRYFKKKIPVFFRGDSTLLDSKGGLKGAVRALFLKIIYRNIDFAFYVGKENKLYFLHSSLRKNQLIFAPHAIDNNRFIDKDFRFEEIAKLWRRNLNISETTLVFLFAGKLEEKKDPFLLLNAFKKLKYKDAILIFVGNGVLEKQLKKQAEFCTRVIFLDFQNQSVMPAVYRLCNVFILPSKGPNETWGLSINEAMACGRVVLVSDKCGCAKDLVHDGLNGYVFESSNEAQLASKMEKLIESQNQLITMGNNSRSYIDRWSYEYVSEVIEQSINRV